MDEGSDPKLDLAIGVGCIWFGLDDPKVKALDYYERLGASLSLIENITDLKMGSPDTRYGGTINLQDEETDYYFPHIYFSEVDFKIFIPTKVQERLEVVCGAENFRVRIVGHYHLPVTYVSGPASDFPLRNPSRAIVLVRRYLKEKLADSVFVCDCIGPSPFHADFLTSEDVEATKLIDVTQDVGYKEYFFGYENSLNSGFDEFSSRYGDTFSLFYYLEHMRGKILDADRIIVNNTNDLLAQSKSGGWFSRARHSITSGRLIDVINEASLEDQVYRSFIGNALEDAERDEPTDRFGDISYHFNDLRRFGVQRDQIVVKDIVSTYEKRRQGLFQNAAVLIAGFAGGILGALLGSALTYQLTTRAAEVSPPSIAPVDLGDGVRLIRSASPSGLCLSAPPGYVGTGSPTKPFPTPDRPLCKE